MPLWLCWARFWFLRLACTKIKSNSSQYYRATIYNPFQCDVILLLFRFFDAGFLCGFQFKLLLLLFLLLVIFTIFQFLNSFTLKSKQLWVWLCFEHVVVGREISIKVRYIQFPDHLRNGQNKTEIEPQTLLVK